MQLYYFPLRGLGEQIRVALAAVGAEYEECGVDFNDMKNNLEHYPFGQCPRLVDGDLDLTQSNAIMRHLGRKYDIYGSSDTEKAKIDQIVDGVMVLRSKYLELIYTHELAEDAKKEHWSKHGDLAGALGQRNGGAHWAYLSNLLKKNSSSGNGPVVGSKLSIADIALADVAHLYVRIYEAELKEAYPDIVAHLEWVNGQQGIKEYLASGKRPAQVNGNPLG